MQKYIHYCWFGGKPLPRLARKCIKSWKKYLPDFEIIEWNESNVNIEECPFVKEAYENKKWAFVADYFRAKALLEYGGIYFDTDMEVTKEINSLLNNTSFLGIEDSGYIAAGVWWEREKNAFLPNKLLKYYQEFKHFPIDNLFDHSIPKVITSFLNQIGFVDGNRDSQILEKDFHIYSRDYFYPLSYNRQNNVFTDNTCMIHYYDATWIPKNEKKYLKLCRTFGTKNGIRIFNMEKRLKKLFKDIFRVVLYPIVLLRRRILKKRAIDESMKKLLSDVSKLDTSNETITIYNKNWLGTKNATLELFDNCLGLESIEYKELIPEYASVLNRQGIKQIVFSAFEDDWFELIDNLKEQNPALCIKVLWHGSNAMHIEDYDWKVFKKIFKYLNDKKIDSIGFVKKSMYEFYKKKGYDVEFVMNTVHLETKYPKKNRDIQQVKIGVYASGDRWVKNFYNQLSAASLVENHLIDCVPLSEKTKEFGSLIKANIVGVGHPISREELLKRIASNDINIYVTFVECAPMIPLESLEQGVPCITSKNHHYFEGTALEDYLVVDSPDNIIDIYKKILYALENKEKIVKLYKVWKKENDKLSKKSVDEFLKIRKKKL